MNHSYRLALVILTAVMLSGCAGLIALVAVEVGVVKSIVAADVDDQAVVADQQKQRLKPGIDIKANKLVSVKTIAILQIPDLPIYCPDIDFCGNSEEYDEFSFRKTSQKTLKQYLARMIHKP
jgi:hypothetical protein